MTDVGKSAESPLPSEIMPSCWNEEERINALFSPFRNKSVNPQDWSSKYKFWRGLIFEWLKFNMRCSFTLADLTNNFKKGNRAPHCLPTVVEELLRSGDIVLESEFLKEPSETWTAWSLDVFVKRPLTWSLSKVKNFIIESEIDKDTTYVHLQVVKELGDMVLSILEENKESILVPFSEIIKDCTYNINNCITDNSVMISLIWLKRQKKVAFKHASSQNELLVKAISSPMDVITEVEEGLYVLMKQENEIIKQIELMEQEKLKVTNEVKSYLAQSMRQIAKTHLRKKVQLERAIEKQAQILGTLQALISDIQNSRTNTVLLAAFKTGSNVLKKLADEGLTESNVAGIMDELSDALEEQREVHAIISNPLDNSGSDAELEEELARLIAADDKPVAKSKSDIEELEESIQNLSIKDSPVRDVTPKKSSSQPTQKKNVAAVAEPI